MRNELNRNDIREIENSIRNLIFDGSSRPIFKTEVNRVFRDLFGLDRGIDQREYMYVGDAFCANGRLAKESRLRMYDVAGIDTLYDMLVATDDYDRSDYRILQTMVLLIKELRSGELMMEKKRNREDDIYEKYTTLLHKLKREYGIRSREPMRNISNPLKMANKLIKEFGDDDEYSSYFGDDYYRDYGNRRRRRRRDDEDDYDYDDYCDRILEGTDYERTKKSSKSKSKSKRRRRDDDDDDYDAEYDDDSDRISDEIIAENFESIAGAIERLSDRIDSLTGGYDRDDRRERQRPRRSSYDRDDYADDDYDELISRDHDRRNRDDSSRQKQSSSQPVSNDMQGVSTALNKIATATTKNTESIGKLRDSVLIISRNQKECQKAVENINQHVDELDEAFNSIIFDEDVDDDTGNVVPGGGKTIDELTEELSSEEGNPSDSSITNTNSGTPPDYNVTC